MSAALLPTYHSSHSTCKLEAPFWSGAPLALISKGQIVIEWISCWLVAMAVAAPAHHTTINLATTLTTFPTKSLGADRAIHNRVVHNKLRARLGSANCEEKFGFDRSVLACRRSNVLAAVRREADYSGMTTPKLRPQRASGILLHPTSLPGL